MKRLRLALNQQATGKETTSVTGLLLGLALLRRLSLSGPDVSRARREFELLIQLKRAMFCVTLHCADQNTRKSFDEVPVCHCSTASNDYYPTIYLSEGQNWHLLRYSAFLRSAGLACYRAPDGKSVRS